MKKSLLLIASAFLLCACGSNASSSTDPSSSYISSASSSTAESTSKGSDIASSSATEESAYSSVSGGGDATSSQETSSDDSMASSSAAESSAEESSVIDESSSAEESTSSIPGIDNHEIYGAYYKDLVSWTDGEDLKQQLHEIISGGTYAPIEYNHNSTSNWQSNIDADLALYDFAFLDVVYSGEHAKKESTSSLWQREHAFCASLMTGSQTGPAVKHLGRATDFHNLFAANSSGNSSRGNKNFGTANIEDDTYQSRLDDNGDGYSFDSKNFEPSDHDKGRLARAIFYMATMYCEEEYDEVNKITMKPLTVVEDYVPYVAGNDCAFAHGNLSTLLEWTKIDVDLSEYQHNESVYSFVPILSSDESKNHAQGNRNPYVDFPELIDYAFGSKKDEPGSLEGLTSSYYALGKYNEGTERYAITQAKRQYVVGEAIEKEHIKVVSVDVDRNTADFADFSLNGMDFGDVFENTGTFKINVETPLNPIQYSVKVVSEDPLQMAQYQHHLTAKSEGDDFANCYDKAGQDNRLNLSGVEWDVYWAQGVVHSNSSKFGCKFGANASSPVGTLRFVTASSFSYQDLTRIQGVYLSGSTASKCSYNLKMSVGDTEIYSGNIAYVDTDTRCERYAKVDPALEGKLKIEITNITNAVYIHTIAVVLEELI